MDDRISFFEQQKFRLRKLIYESEHGANKVVRKDIPQEPVKQKTFKPAEPAQAEHAEPEIQLKMNKADFNRIQAQKARKQKV